MDDDDNNDEDDDKDESQAVLKIATSNLNGDESASIFVVEVNFDVGREGEKKAGRISRKGWSQLTQRR